MKNVNVDKCKEQQRSAPLTDDQKFENLKNQIIRLISIYFLDDPSSELIAKKWVREIEKYMMQLDDEIDELEIKKKQFLTITADTINKFIVDTGNGGFNFISDYNTMDTKERDLKAQKQGILDGLDYFCTKNFETERWFKNNDKFIHKKNIC